MAKSNSDKDVLGGEEVFSSPSEDVYPDATVKISRDQYSIFEIRRMLKLCLTCITPYIILYS